MKTNLLLSTAATLALLLSGCSDTGTNTAVAEIAKNIAGSNTQNGTDNTSDAPASGNTDNDGSADTGSTGGDNGGNIGGEEIPNPGDGGGDIPVTPKKAGGWYARTVVSADAPDGKVYTHSTAGVFGKLIDSEDSLDQHDIPGYGPATLQVLFPQAEQENADSNGYFSEYKAFSEDDDSSGSWEFQIKNQDYPDLSNAPIHISLKGVYDLTYKKVHGKISYEETKTQNSAKAQELTLLDVDNNTYYSVEELETANLTMDGKHTRTFKWVLGTVESSDYTATASTEDDTATIQAFAVNDDANNINIQSATSTAGGKFGLPPR